MLPLFINSTQEHANPQLNLADNYLSASYGKIDLMEAYKIYCNVALYDEEPYAEFMAGFMSENGWGIDKARKDDALSFYELSAKHGFSKAEYKLGLFYLLGIECDKNRSIGLQLLESAANKYLGVACFLIYHYYVKLGMPYKGYKFFRIINSINDEFSCYEIAMCYLNGTIVKKDSNLAKRYLSKSVNYESDIREIRIAQNLQKELQAKAKAEAERNAKDIRNIIDIIETERNARTEERRKARAEAERKAKEEAKRKAKAEAERKAKEEAERKAKEETERHEKYLKEIIEKAIAELEAKKEAERKAREEAERKVKVEAERKAKEEAERKAKEEVERKARLNLIRKSAKKAKLKAKNSNKYDKRTIQKYNYDRENENRISYTGSLEYYNNLWKERYSDILQLYKLQNEGVYTGDDDYDIQANIGSNIVDNYSDYSRYCDVDEQYLDSINNEYRNARIEQVAAECENYLKGINRAAVRDEIMRAIRCSSQRMFYKAIEQKQFAHYGDLYFLSKKLNDISAEDRKRIIVFAEQLLSDNIPHHMKDIYYEFVLEFPKLLKACFITKPFHLFAFLRYIGNEHFNFLKPYISNKNITELESEKQVNYFLKNRKEIIIDELFDFTKRQKIKVYSKLDFLDSIEDYIIIDKNTLINVNKLDLDRSSLEMFFNDVIEEIENEKCMAIRELTKTQNLPKCEKAWTEWMVYSLVKKYCDFLEVAVTSAKFNDAIPVISRDTEKYDKIIDKIRKRYKNKTGTANMIKPFDLDCYDDDEWLLEEEEPI